MKKLKYALFCTFLSLFATAAVYAETPEQIPGTTKVSAEDVFTLLEKYPDLVIVDARKHSDRTKGYIEGSVGLPDTETTVESLAGVVPDKGARVLFYCNGVKCGRSVKSAKNAVAWGYKHVYWFRGGWEEWMAKGLPVAK